ncbi:prepilin peptidase [Bordetella sp. 15P40C-2]|nr:prepilin peptidase [Bordetella sp. 15P40C-2]
MSRLRYIVRVINRGPVLSAGDSLWWLLFVLWNLSVTFSDWHRRKIPNPLIVVAAGLQLLWAGSAMLDIGWRFPPLWPGWAMSMLGMLAAFLFLPLWTRRVMGAGDIKLMAVYGLMFGPIGLAWIIAAGSLLAGLHGVLFITISRVWTLPEKLRHIPYGAYLALGAMSVAPTCLSSL